MNTPGYDPVSLTGLAAGGCNLIAFTTGRGSAIGFPSIPVIKIATNGNTYRRMRDNMDINAGVIADGEQSIQEVGRGNFSDMVLKVASGRPDLRRAARAQGICAMADWAGVVGVFRQIEAELSIAGTLENIWAAYCGIGLLSRRRKELRRL